MIRTLLIGLYLVFIFVSFWILDKRSSAAKTTNLKFKNLH